MGEMNWPECLTEDETLQLIVDGKSLSRFGDGEIGIAMGGGTSTHAPNRTLAKEMRSILLNPDDNCLVAIPSMNPASPKHSNWVRNLERWSAVLDHNRVYGSVFVGQAVSAPWIENDVYIRKFRTLWANKKVALVSHETSGLRALVRDDNVDYVEILCPELEAYAVIDEIEQQCIDAGCDLVLIVAGPMATCLAHRLAVKGIHAVDIGRGVGVVLRYPLEGYS